MGLTSKLFKIGQKTQNKKIFNPLVHSHIASARKSYQAGDYLTTLTYCQEVLRLDASNAEAYQLRGVSKYQLEDLIGAVEDLQRCLQFS